MMKSVLLLAAVLALAALMFGCHTASESSSPSLPLVGTQWLLAGLNGKPFVLSEGLGTPTLTLDPAKKQASGSSKLTLPSIDLDYEHWKPPAERRP
jgi:hypothetical protein